MKQGLKIGVRTKLLVGALALVMATASYASTQVAGGATLPAIGYVGTGAETSLQVISPSANSLFGVWKTAVSSTAVSYCQTGSGSGKNILAGVSGFGVQNACTKDTSGTVHGFGANATGVGRSDLTWPNVVGADSPLSLTDLNNFSADHSSTYLPVEFPAVAGAISIALNETTTNGVVLNNTNTNFSDLQVCLIFSGTVTAWNDSRLASAFTLGTGDSIPADPINVQYRSDGSGTSFSFSNHLSAAGQSSASGECSSITSTSQHFVTDQSFVNVVKLYQPTIPSNWTGSSGNPSVASAVKATAHSVGYVETANSQAAAISFAKVNGKDPSATTDFGSPFAISSTVTNSYINGADANTGRPVVTAISPTPATSCIVLASPDSYALPSSGYPIVAVSYLLGSSQGNGGDLSNVQSLLFAPYNSTVTGSRSLTTFGPGKGLALLSGTGLTSTIINGCVTN